MDIFVLRGRKIWQYDRFYLSLTLNTKAAKRLSGQGYLRRERLGDAVQNQLRQSRLLYPGDPIIEKVVRACLIEVCGSKASRKTKVLFYDIERPRRRNRQNQRPQV